MASSFELALSAWLDVHSGNIFDSPAVQEKLVSISAERLRFYHCGRESEIAERLAEELALLTKTPYVQSALTRRLVQVR